MATIATACGGELTTCAGTTTHWLTVSGVTRDATHVRSGSYALKMSASASSAVARREIAAGNQHVIVRFSLFMPSVPAVLTRLVASSISSRHLYLLTDGTLQFFSEPSASTLPLNEWVTIDLEWDTSANPHTYDWKINGVAQTQATSAVAAADITDLYFGDNTATVTADWWYDDIAISLTDGDYPIPAGTVGGDPETWTNDGPVWTTPADTVSMSTTPELQFTSPTSAVAQHFYLQLDTSAGFASGSLQTFDSSVSQTNWTYWTGAAWAALPSTGLASGYSGNEVRLTITSALSSATWYRRVRAGTLA